MDQNKSCLRFPYDPTGLRSRYLPPHPYLASWGANVQPAFQAPRHSVAMKTISSNPAVNTATY
eukprot:COSAG01_NODE_778_length_13681_cov_15.265130_9_plen_63_part_00